LAVDIESYIKVVYSLSKAARVRANTFAPFEDGRYVIESGKFNSNRAVYFSSYQAMWSENEDGHRVFSGIPSNFFDLIIIDECHRSGYGTWKEILEHFPNAIQLGMTATPKRSDNIDTYLHFGDPRF
jgi:type I restriction enzyme, R subunit